MASVSIKFNEKRRAVLDKLAEIENLVAQLDTRTAKGMDADWANVGDLGRIEASLEDILVTARTM